MLGRVFVLPARPGLLGVLLTRLGPSRPGGGRGALLTSWFFSFSCELTFLFLSQGALVQPADWLLPVSEAVTSVLPSPFRGEVCMDHSRISTRTRGDVVGGAGRRPRLGLTSQHNSRP